MPTCSYREIALVCAALGLKPVRAANGTKWIGVSPLNRRPVLLVVHQHAAGRDVPDGLFQQYLSQLGFVSAGQFGKYLREQT
jgi:hypothetical protein